MRKLLHKLAQSYNFDDLTADTMAVHLFAPNLELCKKTVFLQKKLA